MSWKLTLDGSGEVEPEFFGVACIVLEEDKPLVEGGIQRGQVVEETLPT
jgi:hypothetical protein